MNSNFQSNTQELFPASVVAPPPALVCVSLSLANPSFIASFWSMLEPCGLGPLKPLILHLQMQSLHTQTHTHTTECSHCIHDGDPLCTPEHIKRHGGAGGGGGTLLHPILARISCSKCKHSCMCACAHSGGGQPRQAAHERAVANHSAGVTNMEQGGEELQ